LTDSAQFIASTVFFLFGIFIVLRAKTVALKIKEFYLNYPLIHYAGEKQLTSKPIYIVIFGAVFILISAYGIYLYV